MNATDPLNDPFAIVPDQHKKQRPQRSATNDQETLKDDKSEGYRSTHKLSSLPICALMSQAAANLFGINGRTSSNKYGRPGTANDTPGGPNPTASPTVLDSETNPYAMPVRMNPSKNGLCRSPRLREQWEALMA